VIHGCMLVRNEAGRWIEKVLEQMRLICDSIVVLDDRSTDNTPEICRRYGADVWYSEKSYWGSNEVKQRKFLWELVTHGARDGDWILCLDADETFDYPDYVKSYILQADNAACNGLGVSLYDMWDPTHYRDDKYWTAHYGVWVMAVKYEDKKEYLWREQALHCGRFPINAGCKIAECPVRIQHWGWSRAEDRLEKYERYMKADPEGKHGILAQYKSILDEKPNLRRFEA
jgi:glycosyltransferase involved in cell wall biosynthesis